MIVIPYEDAYKIIDDMRQLADEDKEDVTLYAATLPASVISELHMLFHFGVAVSRNQQRDNVERLVFQLLGYEPVYDKLYAKSYSAEFYNTEPGRACITNMLSPYKGGGGVPVKFVVAMMLAFCATYSRTSIPKLLGLQDED
jgi:hypothetical protein